MTGSHPNTPTNTFKKMRLLLPVDPVNKESSLPLEKLVLVGNKEFSSTSSIIVDCCNKYALRPIIRRLYSVFKDNSGSDKYFDAINAAGIDANANKKAVFESINPLRTYPKTPLLNPKDSTNIAIPTHTLVNMK